MKLVWEDSFIAVTKHYGYYEHRAEIMGAFGYRIVRVRCGKPYRVVALMKTTDSAIHECQYLEKLNQPKFKKEKKK